MMLEVEFVLRNDFRVFEKDVEFRKNLNRFVGTGGYPSHV